MDAPRAAPKPTRCTQRTSEERGGRLRAATLKAKAADYVGSSRRLPEEEIRPSINRKCTIPKS